MRKLVPGYFVYSLKHGIKILPIKRVPFTVTEYIQSLWLTPEGSIHWTRRNLVVFCFGAGMPIDSARLSATF